MVECNETLSPLINPFQESWKFPSSKDLSKVIFGFFSENKNIDILFVILKYFKTDIFYIEILIPLLFIPIIVYALANSSKKLSIQVDTMLVSETLFSFSCFISKLT